jgi:hypothetical protein
MRAGNDVHGPLRETKRSRDDAWKREADKVGRDLAAQLSDAWRFYAADGRTPAFTRRVARAMVEALEVPERKER